MIKTENSLVFCPIFTYNLLSQCTSSAILERQKRNLCLEFFFHNLLVNYAFG